jgi:hypothetical protein
MGAAMKKLYLLSVPLISLCLVFSVSCVTREYEVTESYADTMYRTETHTEILNESQKYIKPNWTNFGPVYFKALEWGEEEQAASYFDGYRIDTSENVSSRVKLVLNEHPLESKWGIIIVDYTGMQPIPDFPMSPVKQNQLIEGKLRYRPEYPVQHWLDNLSAVVMEPGRTLRFVRSDKFYDEDIEVNLGSAKEFMVITCVPSKIVSPPTVIKKVQLISTEQKTVEEQIPYQATKERTVTKTEKVPIWEVIFNK